MDDVREWVYLNHSLRKYGLTLDQYYSLEESQGWCCYLCKEEAKLTIDHCHQTGRVRRLLCRQCNAGVGMFKDNPQTMRNAAIYMEKYNVASF